MEHYVTLFDSTYLPQALALHTSMQRHTGSYCLWMLCLDDTAHDLMTKLALPNCRLLRLADLETPSLKEVKPGRGIAEYCWTLTPFAPRFVFEADASVQRVTYIDADIWFRKSPAPIFAELRDSGAHVLITDHGYAPEHDQSTKCGQYCVQFMTFDRDGGEIVRQWWEDRCIEWCFARYEPMRFGDQKYLDDWPTRFERVVHVLERKEFAQAPWNATRFPYGEAIFFHFQGLRITPNRRIDLAPIYPLSRPLVENVYEPYLVDFRRAIESLRLLGFEARAQRKALRTFEVMRRFLAGVYQQIWRFHFLHYRRY